MLWPVQLLSFEVMAITRAGEVLGRSNPVTMSYRDNLADGDVLVWWQPLTQSHSNLLTPSNEPQKKGYARNRT